MGLSLSRCHCCGLSHLSRGASVSWLPRTNNKGTNRLVKRSAQFGGEVTKERVWTDEERQERAEQAERLNLVRHAQAALRRQQGWKASELRLLGRKPDAEVASRIGRSVNAVRIKRERLGIANPESAAWTEDEIGLVGTMANEEVAMRTGRTVNAVYLKRRKLRRRRGR